MQQVDRGIALPIQTRMICHQTYALAHEGRKCLDFKDVDPSQGSAGCNSWIFLAVD